MTYQSNSRPTSSQSLVDLVVGLTYPFRAIAVLHHSSGLWGYVIIPLVLNIVLGILLYAGLLVTGFVAIDELTANLPAALEVIARIFLAIVLFVVIGFIMVRFGVVLGSPWYGQLSEHLEKDRTGSAPPAEPLSVRGVARDIWRALMFEVKKLLLVLGVTLLLLLLNLIPAVGALTFVVGGTLLGMTIACLDFLDPPLERRRLKFRVKLGSIRQSLPASAGFGLVCFALVSIPFINLLSIPLCITAGTLFFCDYIRVDGEDVSGWHGDRVKRRPEDA